MTIQDGLLYSFIALVAFGIIYLVIIWIDKHRTKKWKNEVTTTVSDCQMYDKNVYYDYQTKTYQKHRGSKPDEYANLGLIIWIVSIVIFAAISLVAFVSWGGTSVANGVCTNYGREMEREVNFVRHDGFTHVCLVNTEDGWVDMENIRFNITEED